ncbi:hypothetical protein DPSP01_009825 [Paraphaeosphaeria sporulosa]
MVLGGPRAEARHFTKSVHSTLSFSVQRHVRYTSLGMYRHLDPALGPSCDRRLETLKADHEYHDGLTASSPSSSRIHKPCCAAPGNNILRSNSEGKILFPFPALPHFISHQDKWSDTANTVTEEPKLGFRPWC